MHAEFQCQSVEDVHRMTSMARFGAAAKAGFPGVEFLFPMNIQRPIKEQLDKHKLKWCCSTCRRAMGSRRARGGVRSGESQSIPGECWQSRRIRTGLGCGMIHCMAGLNATGSKRRKDAQTYIANLQFAGTELAKYTMKVLIEPSTPATSRASIRNYSRQAFDIMHYANVPILLFSMTSTTCRSWRGDLAPTVRESGEIGQHAACGTPGGTSRVPERSTTRSCSDSSTRIGYKAG